MSSTDCPTTYSNVVTEGYQSYITIIKWFVPLGTEISTTSVIISSFSSAGYLPIDKKETPEEKIHPKFLL